MSKEIEILFESGNYDSKNITNKCDKVIPNHILEKLEEQGATFELLQTLGVPVFKYRTQITIHGLFPHLQSTRHFGYVNIFQNKNQSIGVKYNAVDRVKKEKIFRILSKLYNWRISDNSTGYFAYFSSKGFTTKDEYKELLPTFQEIKEKIDKDKLFYGGCHIGLEPSFGWFYLFVSLNLGVIPEENIPQFILNVTGKTIEENEQLIAQKEQAEKEKRQKEQSDWDAEQQRIAEAKKPFMDQARFQLETAGYSKKSVPIFDGMEVITGVSVDLETRSFHFEFKKYTKTHRQKKFRYVTCSVSSLTEQRNYSSWDRETNNRISNAFML